MLISMTTIGLLGAGYMGSGLGAMLLGNGHEVLTTVAGRSARTARLVEAAGIPIVSDLSALVDRAEIILVVTPPAAAVDAARALADAAERAPRTGRIVVDLNAVAPSTMEAIAGIVGPAGFDLVDGTISGAPSNWSDTMIYLSGPRAAEVAALVWEPAKPVLVSDLVGAASAVKMCTASVYKGLSGLLAQALRTADHHGVLDVVIEDVQRLEPRPHIAVALATTKADRFVGEMREIAATQAGAGLTADLFTAYANIYADLATTALASEDPETVNRDLDPATVLTGLTKRA